VLVETIESRYRELWAELTDVEEFDTGEMHRIESRVRRLNALGFDVAELDITTDFAGSTVRIQPKVVDAGHHQRRLIRLTGLDTEENQARRLLNDLDYHRARTDQQGADESIVAHQWLTIASSRSSSPCRRRCGPSSNPPSSTTRCWSTVGSERAGRGGGADHGSRAGYVNNVLHRLPDEEIALSMESMGPLANPYDPSQGYIDEDYVKPYDPWEDDDEAPDEEEEPLAAYLDIAALRAKAKK
jgi:hypothetical protein